MGHATNREDAGDEPTSTRRGWVDALVLIVSAILITLAAIAAFWPAGSEPSPP